MPVTNAEDYKIEDDFVENQHREFRVEFAAIINPDSRHYIDSKPCECPDGDLHKSDLYYIFTKYLEKHSDKYSSIDDLLEKKLHAKWDVSDPTKPALLVSEDDLVKVDFVNSLEEILFESKDFYKGILGDHHQYFDTENGHKREFASDTFGFKLIDKQSNRIVGSDGDLYNKTSSVAPNGRVDIKESPYDYFYCFYNTHDKTSSLDYASPKRKYREFYDPQDPTKSEVKMGLRFGRENFLSHRYAEYLKANEQDLVNEFEISKSYVDNHALTDDEVIVASPNNAFENNLVKATVYGSKDDVVNKDNSSHNVINMPLSTLPFAAKGVVNVDSYKSKDDFINENPISKNEKENFIGNKELSSNYVIEQKLSNNDLTDVEILDESENLSNDLPDYINDVNTEIIDDNTNQEKQVETSNLSLEERQKLFEQYQQDLAIKQQNNEPIDTIIIEPKTLVNDLLTQKCHGIVNRSITDQEGTKHIVSEVPKEALQFASPALAYVDCYKSEDDLINHNPIEFNEKSQFIGNNTVQPHLLEKINKTIQDNQEAFEQAKKIYDNTPEVMRQYYYAKPNSVGDISSCHSCYQAKDIIVKDQKQGDAIPTVQLPVSMLPYASPELRDCDIYESQDKMIDDLAMSQEVKNDCIGTKQTEQAYQKTLKAKQLGLYEKEVNELADTLNNQRISEDELKNQSADDIVDNIKKEQTEDLSQTQEQKKSEENSEENKEQIKTEETKENSQDFSDHEELEKTSKKDQELYGNFVNQENDRNPFLTKNDDQPFLYAKPKNQKEMDFLNQASKELYRDPQSPLVAISKFALKMCHVSLVKPLKAITFYANKALAELDKKMTKAEKDEIIGAQYRENVAALPNKQDCVFARNDPKQQDVLSNVEGSYLDVAHDARVLPKKSLANSRDSRLLEVTMYETILDMHANKQIDEKAKNKLLATILTAQMTERELDHHEKVTSKRR